VAPFAGVWVGVWEDSGELCHTLVVEEVLANGYARVIYSVGTSLVLNIRLPGFLRATGRIVDGELRVRLPIRDRPARAYRVVGEALQATREDPDGHTGRARLTRLADLTEVGCGPQGRGLRPAPPAMGPRDRLTATELRGSPATGVEPVHNAYFMPVGPAAPALHAFQGIVTVHSLTLFRARHGCAGVAERLPAFSVAFFTEGERLVPVVRDLLEPPGLILSSGRVWSEPGDGGWSRASFPFVLTHPSFNSSYNGLATFLYDDTQVSALRVQVVQETAPRAAFDGWGQTRMTYTPGPPANDAAVRAQFAAELRQQTPIRPWSAVPVAAGSPGVEGFDGDTAPEDVTASGLIVDGVIYLRGCETRWGPYPYCREMRHGVFSVTKSLGAAVALLRLAQTYGDQVFDVKIKDYVPVTAAHDGWDAVTFGHALDMATGIGDNAPQRWPHNVFADDETPKMIQRFLIGARTAQEKLDVTFSYGRYPWGPGQVVRYNSTHTFVLAAAMDRFLKTQAGPHAHLWEVVVAEVFQPLGIFHAPMRHTQETDGGRGIPHLLHGLYPTLDDLAKLTTLLQQGGRHEGQQVLHAGRLAEALYQTDAKGLPTGWENRFGEGRYHRSFWSMPYRTATGCPFQIPFMSGVGGNVVVLLPNGITAFRIADGGHYDLEAMVRASEAVRPFPCAAGAAAAAPELLGASDLEALFAGHTLYAEGGHRFPFYDRRPVYLYLGAGGVLYGTSHDGVDVGTWHITPDGQWCCTWHVWDGRRERCYAVSRVGTDQFSLYPHDTWDRWDVTRRPGIPEGY
jgi:Beta-lactamase